MFVFLEHWLKAKLWKKENDAGNLDLDAAINDAIAGVAPEGCEKVNTGEN
jgi:hypothetical protein